MPVNGFEGPLTLAAGVNRLLTLLIAAGYTGRFGFTRAIITNRTGASVYIARRADVDATNGKEIPDGEFSNFAASTPGTVDMNKMYVYSAAGGTIEFSGETR